MKKYVFCFALLFAIGEMGAMGAETRSFEKICWSDDGGYTWYDGYADNLTTRDDFPPGGAKTTTLRRFIKDTLRSPIVLTALRARRLFDGTNAVWYEYATTNHRWLAWCRPISEMTYTANLQGSDVCIDSTITRASTETLFSFLFWQHVEMIQAKKEKTPDYGGNAIGLLVFVALFSLVAGNIWKASAALFQGIVTVCVMWFIGEEYASMFVFEYIFLGLVVWALFSFLRLLSWSIFFRKMERKWGPGTAVKIMQG